MHKLIVNGGNRLKGEIKVSGAKNVAMKVILAGLLTDGEILVKNVPNISSVTGTAEIVKKLGLKVNSPQKHSLSISGGNLKNFEVPLELGGFYRTGTMVLGPLLTRFGKAVVPNPGGCRIGKRPIDRHIDGLKAMGAKIEYQDGYFYAQADRLSGIRYTFSSNTHTGTETLILAAVLANGETVLDNAAEEPEIDDLICLLNKMGAKIRRTKKRTIIIHGVVKLHGADFEIMPDRNEVVTFAIAAISSKGNLIIKGVQKKYLGSFLDKLELIGGAYEEIDDIRTRFYYKVPLRASEMTTKPYPGFMTDWQAPWSLLMTQATGISTVHETVYEDRFDYVKELIKMGAKIDYFNPAVDNPDNEYNFNWADRQIGSFHALRIQGPVKLHNAILEVNDLRAGATLLLGANLAPGESVITGVDHIDRGYEAIEERLTKIGMKIKRVTT